MSQLSRRTQVVLVGVVAVALAVALLVFGRSRGPVTGEIIVYGDAPSNFGRLWVPETRTDRPVVVLVHGGFWRRDFSLDLMDPLAERLSAEGYAVWNIEYGRVGEGQGGWPFTFDDVASAIDEIAVLDDTYAIDSSKVAVVGHSAGGHLALWSDGQTDVEATVLVGLGAVVDLDLAVADGLGNDAVGKLLGGPASEVPERYSFATPVPTAPVVLINGTADEIVATAYSQPIGFDAQVITLHELDHFALIASEGPATDALLEVLRTNF